MNNEKLTEAAEMESAKKDAPLGHYRDLVVFVGPNRDGSGAIRYRSN